MADFLAIDLGATSGRVAIGRADSDAITLEIVHRFAHNVVEQADGSLLWDWGLIFTEILTGLNEAIKSSSPVSLAVDSWAVDYGFIYENQGFKPPIHAYRDPRNAIAFEELTSILGKEKIYRTTGIQFLPFNTIYQLYSCRNTKEYLDACNFLMLPDLVNFLLTGKISTEVTNASSTQLLNAKTRTWDEELIAMANLKKELFSNLHEPGTFIGEVQGYGELNGIKVVATASHDTAAAIAGVPFENRAHEAYISSGTWSLVGIETTVPYSDAKALEINLTNELGVEGTVRVLKNVTGMWLLEECRRAWAESGHNYEITQLLELADDAKNFETLIDPNDPIFAPPGEMPDRISKYCSDRGLFPPTSPGEFSICILKSLAHAYKKTLIEITSVTGVQINTLHILGGGSQNNLLNQLTADICGVTVKTGPIEATLYGNIAVQAISAGIYKDLAQAREVIKKSFNSRVFQPM